MSTRKIIVLVILILSLIVVIQNTQVVDLHLLFWKISMSQILYSLIILLLGFVMGYLLGKRKKKVTIEE